VRIQQYQENIHKRDLIGNENFTCVAKIIDATSHSMCDYIFCRRDSIASGMPRELRTQASFSGVGCNSIILYFLSKIYRRRLGAMGVGGRHQIRSDAKDIIVAVFTWIVQDEKVTRDDDRNFKRKTVGAVTTKTDSKLLCQKRTWERTMRVCGSNTNKYL
jgi:hypothetical protein